MVNRGSLGAPNPRRIAANVLRRVHRDKAFAAASIDAELSAYPQLSDQDRALVTLLVFGVLKCQAYLDKQINACVNRSVNSQVREHLRIAVYQLALLNKIPDYAVVSQAVELVRRDQGKYAGAFANAVLRTIAKKLELEGRPDPDQVRWESVPDEVARRLCAALGSADLARQLVLGDTPVAPTSLRIFHGETSEWQYRLAEAAPGATIEPARHCSHCLNLHSAGRIARLPGFETHWIVQEQGSQLVALALGAKPGERVLDACAGRGNKSLVLMSRVGPEGRVDVADLYESKLALCAERAKSLGFSEPTCFPVDWSVGSGDVPTGYDRVLVDAPCTGTGTLRRKAELMYNNLDEKLAGLLPLQRSILTRAASRCKPGARVIYAVCSVLPEEGPELVREILETTSEFQPVPFEGLADSPVFQGKTSVLLHPGEHGTDGYFIASFRKT